MIARIVQVGERQPTPILEQLVASGRAVLARRPGHRPRMRPGDGTDVLSRALAEMREEELLAPELDGLLTYDDRRGKAATDAGLPVISPRD